MLQALAISGLITAVMIFTLGGAWRSSSQNTTMATDSTYPAQTLSAPIAGLAESKHADEAAVAKKAATARKQAPARKASEQVSKEQSKTTRLTHLTARTDKRDSDGKRKDAPSHAAIKAPGKIQASSAPAATSHDQNGVILASKTSAVQDRYAQCLELGNFLRREQCKWQTCSGKWGQDGCPAYKKDNEDIN